jgi:hypothetical protein
MTVEGGDQLVSGAAPEFQDTPGLPIGLGPVEIDGRLATWEQPVIQPRIRVEPFTHETHPLSQVGTTRAAIAAMYLRTIVLTRPDVLHGLCLHAYVSPDSGMRVC